MAVTPPRPVPVSVMYVPKVPLAGLKDASTGMITKPGRDPVLAAQVTTIFPEAPAGTTAVMVVEDTTLKDVAGTPPKLTLMTLKKLLPVMVTVVPVAAVVGVNELMVGGGM